MGAGGVKRYEGWRLDRERKQASRKKREDRAIIERYKINIDKLQTGLNHIIENRDNKIIKQNEEIKKLKQDCKNLIEINNNQAELNKAVKAENEAILKELEPFENQSLIVKACIEAIRARNK